MSNPKPTSISWHKADKELVSAFSNYSLCYKMSNVLLVFSGDNKRIQDNKESAVEIKVKVYSPSEIICHHITEIGVSENDPNAAENLDDGYEKPYSTLVANIEVEDNHVYVTTKNNPNIQQVSPFVHAAYRHFFEFTEQNYSLDEAKNNSYAKEGQENMKQN
ncbi:unnamed protein product [Mytilus coruscus]|uniref:Uncharacterized protein n=1 Tax=Mytilus coruscus TaxID=42192 RepID=A0A6J8EBL2_MYTCO|nr:unnamed protein product [Mytilus coruscus]